ncbi:MAG: hypothetical protein AAF707_02055 [Pseudomonadota bacterium]
MDLPKLDLSTLPGLDTAQGLFGSANNASASYDDRIVDIMVYIYDVLPPEILG